MTVYVDVLFLMDFFMDTVIIFITSIILKRYTKPRYILFGAVTASLYSVAVFVFGISFSASIIGKLLASAITVFLTFGRKNFVKSYVMFWFVTMFGGGVMLGLSILTNYAQVMQATVINCGIYLNMNPVLMAIGSIIMYSLAEFYRRMCIKNFCRDGMCIKLTAVFENTEISFVGLIDTGCELSDPLSGEVIILAYDKAFYNIPKTGYKIPIRTATGENDADLLMPKLISGKNEKYEIHGKYMIALTDKYLNRDGMYTALINPECVNEIKQNERVPVYEKLC